jgi:hypothetical protein
MARLCAIVCLFVASTVSAFHPNDDCSTALPLSIPASGSMSTSGAATDPLTPCSPATPQNGVWFTVVGDGTLLRFSTCSYNSFGNTSAQVFSGTCGTLSCVGGTQESFCSYGGEQVIMTWCSVPGTVYYIHLGGTTGTISVDYFLTSIGACNYTGGNCIPQPLTAPITLAGTTYNRDDCCYSDGADHHYVVTLPYTSSWKFEVCPNGSGSSNMLWLGTTFCDDDICTLKNDNVDPPNGGCYPSASCGCLLLNGAIHVTIEFGGDDGAGGPHLLKVKDCLIIDIGWPNWTAFVQGGVNAECAYLYPNTPHLITVSGVSDSNPENVPQLTLSAVGIPCGGGGTSPPTWHYDPASWQFSEGLPGVPGKESPFWYNSVVGLTEGWLHITFEGILGVELLSFDAQPLPSAALLQWTTASEQDISSFQLYRNEQVIASLPASNSATGEHYAYRDEGLENGTTYSYSLYVEEIGGERARLASASATPYANSEIVGGFALAQNYPNPFNPETTIEFSLNEAGLARLSVFDLTGREVAVLVNGNLSDGAHSVKFDGSALSSGIYFYRLEHNGSALQQKMALLK